MPEKCTYQLVFLPKMIESANFWFWSKGPMVQSFMKSYLIESENVWFWSKGPMVQPFMKSHLIESDNFWLWSKGPKIHPFLKCHLTESVDFFIWLSRFPSYWICQAGVEEPKPHFITAWPHKHPWIWKRWPQCYAYHQSLLGYHPSHVYFQSL